MAETTNQDEDMSKGYPYMRNQLITIDMAFTSMNEFMFTYASRFEDKETALNYLLSDTERAIGREGPADPGAWDDWITIIQKEMLKAAKDKS